MKFLEESLIYKNRVIIEPYLERANNPHAPKWKNLTRDAKFLQHFQILEIAKQAMKEKEGQYPLSSPIQTKKRTVSTLEDAVFLLAQSYFEIEQCSWIEQTEIMPRIYENWAFMGGITTLIGIGIYLELASNQPLGYVVGAVTTVAVITLFALIECSKKALRDRQINLEIKDHQEIVQKCVPIVQSILKVNKD